MNRATSSVDLRRTEYPTLVSTGMASTATESLPRPPSGERQRNLHASSTQARLANQEDSTVVALMAPERRTKDRRFWFVMAALLLASFLAILESVSVSVFLRLYFSQLDADPICSTRYRQRCQPSWPTSMQANSYGLRVHMGLPVQRFCRSRAGLRMYVLVFPAQLRKGSTSAPRRCSVVSQ